MLPIGAKKTSNEYSRQRKRTNPPSPDSLDQNEHEKRGDPTGALRQGDKNAPFLPAADLKQTQKMPGL